jgi:hypothetical protein
MAITLTGTGGLFTRLGKLFGLAKTIRQHQQAIAPTSMTATSGVRAIYSAFASTTGTLPMATDLVAAIGSEDQLAAASGSALSSIRAAAHRTLIEMVDADVKLPEKTVDEALKELAVQMIGSSASIARTTYTVGSPSYSARNQGDAVVIVSTEATKVIRDRVVFSSKLLDFPAIRPETITLNCVADARMSGISAGSETWEVLGERAYPNLDRRWRSGSGAMMRITQTSASIDGGASPGRNILRNSDFEEWDANGYLPDGWAVSTGTAGTHFAKISIARRGSLALMIAGDGSTLAKIRQRLNSVTGTIGRLRPDTLYCLAFSIRHDGTAPAAGVLKVAVQNSAGSDQGSMYKSVTLSALSSSYALQTLAVMSPVDLASDLYLAIELTTALSNGRNIYLDDLTISEMPRLARGGPGVAIIEGTIDSIRGDLATIAISLNESGEFNLELDRHFNLYESGLALPSAASTSATINDSLIS